MTLIQLQLQSQKVICWVRFKKVLQNNKNQSNSFFCKKNNGPTPASFCLFSFFFKQKFYRTNCRLQRDSNLDCRKASTLTTCPQPYGPSTDRIVLKRWANPGLFYHLFSVFSNKHHYNFTTNVCEKMSIQYTVPGFEPTAFGTWVSSHNHYTRAPARIVWRVTLLMGWRPSSSSSSSSSSLPQSICREFCRKNVKGLKGNYFRDF